MHSMCPHTHTHLRREALVDVLDRAAAREAARQQPDRAAARLDGHRHGDDRLDRKVQKRQLADVAAERRVVDALDLFQRGCGKGGGRGVGGG